MLEWKEVVAKGVPQRLLKWREKNQASPEAELTEPYGAGSRSKLHL